MARLAFVVFCRLRYRLTLRDLSEILLLRGFTVSHECVRQWEAKLLPVMGEALRKRRHRTGRSSGRSWYVDETYLKVHGRWCYLYRAIDRDGNLIDTMLSATRDMSAARRFFRSARSVAGFVPDRVTTDGHNSYPRAIRSTLGRAPVAASTLRAATDVRAWFILVSPFTTIIHTRVPDLLLGLAGDPAPWPDGTSLHHTSPINDDLTGVGLGN